MNVTHHLTDETIQDYAAGGLSVPMETLVACHMTVCSHCRLKAELADGIGGAVIAEVEPATVALSASELIARASLMPTHTAAGTNGATAVESLIPGIPRPLARLLPTSLEELKWRRIAPGIKQFKLSKQHRRDGAFQLLHLEPGVELSAHSHNDRELTYLVQGSYTDELGKFEAGDIADLDNHATHRPLIDGHIPCIALIATQSPVRYESVFGKIMQPFVGI
ncbi:ChrR family anti-sigma-E factor [Granulosicoccus antarcticus]|uniref:Anti-sigma-E factor ChrR n=1 Tax=Granulosicoccus antarcticus IMCC3135 TaxID=1192854 RepID=A0A2Z2NX21_9GAMM|nr:ChrR family anti-sigma-E factor [Granulosicoccus antarcticus]ASJ71704.1 Anti-sigma-E factor ChrR [Granulosicoccus antarcticus IMCC3135]